MPQLTECREYEQLLSLKNEIIYQLLNRKIVISKQTVENFDCAAQEELKRWIELYKDCSDQLEEFNQICYFCGNKFDPENVNNDCSINNYIPQPHVKGQNYGYTEDTPPSDFVGNQRCYWGKPNAQCKQDWSK